jgi:hypothetical protein
LLAKKGLSLRDPSGADSLQGLHSKREFAPGLGLGAILQWVHLSSRWELLCYLIHLVGIECNMPVLRRGPEGIWKLVVKTTKNMKILIDGPGGTRYWRIAGG